MNARDFFKQYNIGKVVGTMNVVDFAKAYHKQATPPTKPVTEEEIEKEAKKRNTVIAFVSGAKWMRDKAITQTVREGKKKLYHCDFCNQSTKHVDEVCQKCKPF